MDSTDYLESLKQQLSTLGYSDYQLDEIVQDMIGTCNCSMLSPDQYLILVTAMEDYIAFAQKCLKKKVLS